MKKYCVFLVVMVLVSCTDRYIDDVEAGDFPEQAPASEIDVLIEKARWGDGGACLKLADCYRDGIGVKPDFVNMMNMLTLAEDFGAINRVEDYFGCLPADSELEILSKWAKDPADYKAVLGALNMERGDTLQGRQMIEAAIEQESSLAMLLSCAPSYSGPNLPGITKLVETAEKVPYAYKMLGNIYSGEDYLGLKDEKLAAYYYLKADQYTCLGKEGARWLINYYRNGGELNLSEKDQERLLILSKEVYKEPVDAPVIMEDVDEVIEVVDDGFIEEIE